MPVCPADRARLAQVNTAIGGSTNAPPHLQAIARHAQAELYVQDLS